jgi:hypothetical protein
MLEFNDYRRIILKEHHEKSLQLMVEEHGWKKEKHLLEMEILGLQKSLLMAQLSGYQTIAPPTCVNTGSTPCGNFEQPTFVMQLLNPQ